MSLRDFQRSAWASLTMSDLTNAEQHGLGSPSTTHDQVWNEKRGNLIEELFRRSALEIRQDHD
jgi:hypothetical protein